LNIIVTGGAGFLGRRLVNALLQRGSLSNGQRERTIDRIRVCDVAKPDVALPDDPRLETVYVDISEPGAAKRLVDSDTDLVFHLAAVVSGEAEQDFDLGMRVNLHGTMRLLEACRARETCPRFVFASSVAVYGGEMPAVIEDGTAATPQTSYGAQKAMAELLVNDYSRKAFVDGRALRLPTIVVRPGKPNKAASSFASAILRDPLQGREVVCPVSEDTGVWVLSPRRVVECFLHTAELPAERWGSYRSLVLPGLTTTVREMAEALRAVAGDSVAQRIRFEPDPFIERIVYGWPIRFAPRRAEALGFRADGDMHEVIEAFVEDDLGGRPAAP